MTVIAERLAQVVVGSPLHHLNLTLYPLLAEGPATPDYRLLDEALTDGSARVEEVSASGSVPELCFINRGDRSVLLLDGEELVGAKQNRILNLSVLAPAGQRIVIPVSCVEAGRWHADSTEFRSARRAHYATGRARKSADVSESLRRHGSRYSDQRAVWCDIEGKSRRLGVVSRTGAAAAMYDCLRRRLDTFQGAFSPQANQCGALFAINGRLQGLDLFDSPATLAAVLGKLVESYALDAIDWADAPPADLPDAPQPWIGTVAAAGIASFPALGEGEDWRLHSAGVAGGALVKDGRLIHLCAFRSAERGGPGGERPDPERRDPTGSERTVFSRRHSGAVRGGANDQGREEINHPRLSYLPLLDNPELAATCRRALEIPRQQAAELGESALEAIAAGAYSANGWPVNWRRGVAAAVAAKGSLPPDAPLPPAGPAAFATTRVQVVNATTLDAAAHQQMNGWLTLALNFGNGFQAGGDFLQGHAGQEQVLCRSSALYATLRGDPMYAAHRERPLPDATDWAILSPDVPVFRHDDGTPRTPFWRLSILTCAAPYAPALGTEASAALMETRIRRILAIARAFEFTSLILGAWGCGADGNDPARTAAIFHAALREQAGAFRTVVFAIPDWSPERKSLGPFAAEFGDRT